MGNAESLAVVCCDAADPQTQRGDGSRGIISPKGQEEFERPSSGRNQQRVLHFKPAKLASSPFGADDASQSSERMQRTFPGQRMVSLSPGQPVFDGTSSGQPLVSSASTLVSGSSASTLVSGLPSVRLTQAEREFSRGSSFSNLPCPATPATLGPYDALPLDCDTDAEIDTDYAFPHPTPVPPVTDIGGVELARALGLNLRRESEPHVMEPTPRSVLSGSHAREPVSIDLMPDRGADMVWPLPRALPGRSNA